MHETYFSCLFLLVSYFSLYLFLKKTTFVLVCVRRLGDLSCLEAFTCRGVQLLLFSC